jgi:hypothetical protein
MNSSNPLHFLLTYIPYFLPTFLASIAGVILSVTKRKQAPDAAMWALFGFGLALILCITTPIGQWLIQSWVFENGNHDGRMWVFTGFGIVNSVLHAVVYVLLAVAVFAGRTRAS